MGLDATSDPDRIFRAYNDSKGVTEQFYRNGLEHANRLLGHQAFKEDEWQVQGEYVEKENQHRASYVALQNVVVDGVEIKSGTKLQFEMANKFRDEQSDEVWRSASLIPKAVYTNSEGTHRKCSEIFWTQSANVQQRFMFSSQLSWTFRKSLTSMLRVLSRLYKNGNNFG